MIVTSSLGGPGNAPARRAGTLLVASVDVEWSKNYRVPNGNRTFCYSVVWLAVPDRRRPVDLARQSFAYTSAYVTSTNETANLVDLAATDIASALEAADYITGHQLCSDLAVLAANAGPNLPASVDEARQAWRERRTDPFARIVDTRFDADAILTGRSRRLVDVCGELDLDVTQPELARKSMTALHRDWLTNNDNEARERITVLNLRHSLSTALVGLRTAGRGTWTGPLNVNQMLATGLGQQLSWLEHPTFRALT
jgi:hypothetical protein